MKLNIRQGVSVIAIISLAMLAACIASNAVDKAGSSPSAGGVAPVYKFSGTRHSCLHRERRPELAEVLKEKPEHKGE